MKPLAVLVALAVLTGCGTAVGGTFADQPGTLTCLRHQADTPGSAYTGGTGANTGRVLTMLRYYTANGRKPYCDGRSASATDRRWADLYVRLGADAGNVAPILHAG